MPSSGQSGARAGAPGTVADPGTVPDSRYCSYTFAASRELQQHTKFTQNFVTATRTDLAVNRISSLEARLEKTTVSVGDKVTGL